MVFKYQNVSLQTFQNETEPESLCSEVPGSDVASGLLNSCMPIGSQWGSQGFHRYVSRHLPSSTRAVEYLCCTPVKNQTHFKPPIAWHNCLSLLWNRKGAATQWGSRPRWEARDAQKTLNWAKSAMGTFPLAIILPASWLSDQCDVVERLSPDHTSQKPCVPWDLTGQAIQKCGQGWSGPLLSLTSH